MTKKAIWGLAPDWMNKVVYVFESEEGEETPYIRELDLVEL